MGRLTRGCAAAASVVVLLAIPAAGEAALPSAGARFESHDHKTKGAMWHVELNVARRDRTLLRTVVLYDERCDETILAERLSLTPEGALYADGRFEATDAGGKEQAGTWELHLRFVTPRRVEGSFRLAEPGCDAGQVFADERGGQAHRAHELRYADPAAATPAARSQARRMLRRVRAAATGRLPTIEHARAAGFSRYMSPGKPAPGIFHLWSKAFNRDASILDPERPESLVYWKPTRPGAAPVLLAYMFRAHPGPRPRFAGTIPTWHDHQKGGDQMIHVWLTRDLRSAYANCLPVPELERSLHRFEFEEDIRIGLHESKPCPQN